MNHAGNGNDSQKETFPSDAVSQLLRLAGPPSLPSADCRERVRTAAQFEWQKRVKQRRTRKRMYLTGAAALLAAVLIPSTLVFSPWSPGGPARVTALQGTAFALVRNGQDPQALTVGDQIELNTPIYSGPRGQLGLRLATGMVVRLNCDTKLVIENDTRIALTQGTVYLDSDGPEGHAPGMVIATPYGEVRDVGTRFSVGIQDQGLLVRVRDGLVVFRTASGQVEAAAGTELKVDRNGKVERKTVPVFGEDWSWVMDIAASPDLDGRTLADFLNWVVRETGWQVKFEDDAMAQMAAATTLSGSGQALTLKQALALVMPACGLEFQRQENLLFIRYLDGGGEVH